jgi:hypothetical protein
MCDGGWEAEIGGRDWSLRRVAVEMEVRGVVVRGVDVSCLRALDLVWDGDWGFWRGSVVIATTVQSVNLRPAISNCWNLSSEDSYIIKGVAKLVILHS